MLHESPNSPHRTIFTDGRELPKDPNPTWLGYSVGHWEQDTLVVDSAGFNDRGWLDVGGHPQTETLRITERFRRRDVGHLEFEMTLDDPKTFTRPFTLRTDKAAGAGYRAAGGRLRERAQRCAPRRRGDAGAGGARRSTPGPTSSRQDARRWSRSPATQLIVQDSANPADRLFVARSETEFLSSLSQVVLEFVKDAQGNVTHFTRTGAGPTEKAVRKRIAGN